MDIVDRELTPRQVEVLNLVAQGWRNKRIAEELLISIHTVKNHVNTICRKYQVTNRTQLTVLWLKEQPKVPGKEPR